MRESDPIVGLEIGTSKVRALVAQPRDDDHLMIIGLGECPSRGIRKSEVFDFENALSCVRVALQNAEENADVNIRSVYLVVSGGHIQSSVNRGSVPILRDNREITRDDVDHVMDAARAVNISEDREKLHTICQSFYVDGQRGVVNPVGLEGSRLEADMLILHGIRSRLKNMVKIARSVPVDVQDVAFSGLCSALAVLSPTDKENGVLLIDLGGGTTSYVCYAAGAIASAGCLGVGGDHLTNDLARGLRIPQFQAESLKEEYGSATVNPSARAQKIELKNEGGMSKRFIRMGDIQIITSLRAEEILELVKSQIDGDLLRHLGGGIVLTGGGAYLQDMAGKAERIFGLPCQLGKPRDVSGLAVASSSSEYAASIGLLRYAVRTAEREVESLSISSLIRKILGM